MSKTTKKRVYRFLIDQMKEVGQVVDLSEDAMHHASRVLRLLDGSEVQAWDGCGAVWPATLHYTSKKSAHIQSTGPALSLPNNELIRPVYIAQALPESDKMDWVLEKCTEMGAAGFFPIQAERSVVKLTDQRAAKRQQHWKKTLQSASTQSERLYLPKLAEVQDLRSFMSTSKQWPEAPDILLCTPGGATPLPQWMNTQPKGPLNKPLVVLVGPEGGWSEGEISEATSQGAQSIEFCPRVLRTETFGLACLSQLVLGLELEATMGQQTLSDHGEVTT